MATGGTNLYRYLQQRLPGMIQKRYRDLPFDDGTIVPTDATLAAGVQELVAETVDGIGDADVLGDGAFDIPIVDLDVGEDAYKVLMIASAMSYTFQQERAMNFAGRTAQLNTRREGLVTRSISERRSRIAAFGDRRFGITGFLNNPNVSLDNSSFNPYDAGTVPDELFQFFVAIVRDFYLGSNNVGFPAGCLVSTGLYFKLIGTRMTDGATTLKDFIENALREDEIPFVIRKNQESESARLEANGVQAAGTNKDRITLYVRERDTVERMIEPIQMMPPDYVSTKDARKVFPFFSCVTPTMVHQPLGMRYIDVTKAVLA
ncbi:MAG TPA: major capsid family protein [Trichocoleus sp.]